ncbi:Hypothetical protein CAP_0161 [Chondromyces apiculatus DSM 436]|uniref:Uncharacterized protein n=1 Tax=Chondromyces apiculatus DSM 436 TaxID=1192034 RepID=A0A017TDN7_9BACT|nr:Hypothetical protein CAP_0161 [Chondromyces apiculatus DSM 436]
MLSTASFILKFDRFLHPATVTRQSVCITSDLTRDVRTLDDCQRIPGAARLELEPTYNPVEREAIYRRRADSPRLSPGQKYRIAVLAPSSDEDLGGFRAFDQAPLERTVQIDVSVLDQDPPGVRDELLPGADLYCRRDPACLGQCDDDACRQACALWGFGVQPYLQACAAGGGCHANPEFAGAGLSLASSDLIRLTAIGKVAHQTQTGEHAADPDLSPRRFGRAMPIIDPQNPGNSYLLYKMLIGPNALEPTLSTAEGSDLAGERERLHASVVVGMPMPPQSTPSFWLHDPGDPEAAPGSVVPRIDGGDIDLITAWILHGAPTRDCALPPYD